MLIEVKGDYFVCVGATFEQSQWLGQQGWWLMGPRSAGFHANRLRVHKLAGWVRYLPTSEAATVARIAHDPQLTWSPEARALVVVASANTTASREAESDFEVPAPAGLTYRPYQRGGVETIWRGWEAGVPGVLIGDEMGLGKTMQAIGAIARCSPRRVLVMTLASVRENFAREIRKWLPERAAKVATTAEDVLDGEGITVVSYSSVVGPSNRAKALKEKLLNEPWDFVVLDEAHTLKNDKSQASKNVLGAYTRGVRKEHGIATRGAFVVVLTGTPIQNKVRESIVLLRAVGLVGDGAPLGNEGRFLFRYCGPSKVWTGSRYVTTFDGATNLPELQANLRGSGRFVRRLKVDVAKELPPKLRSLILVGNSDDVAEHDPYATLLPEGEALDFSAVQDLVSRTVEFEALAAYRAKMAVLKAPYAIEHVSDVLDELEPDGKVLVFAHHEVMLDRLQAQFGAIAIRIDGKTPTDERIGLVDRFQNDPAIRVALLSTRAAGTGITLTAASVVVFAEADWNPAMCLQAEDRAHRIGQDAASVTVHYLAINGSLDARVIAVMAAKMNVADQALDVVPTQATPAPAAPPSAPAAEPVDPSAPVTVELVSKGRQRDQSGQRVQMSRETITLTRDQRDAVAEALVYLKGRCDGAITEDDVGFNGRDAQSEFVQNLVNAARAGNMTPKQAAWGQKILATYRRTQIAHLAPRIWPEA